MIRMNFICDYALASPNWIMYKIENLIPKSIVHFNDIDEDRFLLIADFDEMEKEKLFSLVQPFLYCA